MKENGRGFRRRAAQFFVAALAVVFLGGCGVREALTSGKKGEKEYGKAETLVILTTERLRYEELYSDQIWTAAVDNRGTTFEAALLEQIHGFLKEVRVMSLMAKEEEVSLTSREKELKKAAADRYFSSLGEENAKLLGLDSRAAEELYEDYWLAQKLVEKLTGGVNLEVSDSEAKVVTVAQIVVSDREKAQAALALLQDGSSDFSSVAKEYSEEKELKKQLFRGLMGEAYETAAYGLLEGETSGIVEEDGKYYILKCVDDYDESATRLHKEQMVQQKKNEAFYHAYGAYESQMELSGDEKLWEELSIKNAPRVEADFFGVFEEVCAGEEKNPS